MIRNAVSITEKAIKDLVTMISIGVSEKELAGKLMELAMQYGADGIAFSPIVAIGKNTSKPHHVPQNTRFEGREPILIDFGVRFRGYVSDITRMIIPKELESTYSQVVSFAEELSEFIDIAVSEIKPNVKANYIDSIVRDKLKERGLATYFIHGLGHGIGVEVHEAPRISPISTDEIFVGDVLTIEPGIYIHNKFGVRIEEDVYIDNTGSKVLTSLQRIIQI